MEIKDNEKIGTILKFVPISKFDIDDLNHDIHETDPLIAIVKKERNICLWTAFYSLSEENQIIVFEYAINGKSFIDIGQQIGMSYKSIKISYYYSLNVLKFNFNYLYHCGYYLHKIQTLKRSVFNC